MNVECKCGSCGNVIEFEAERAGEFAECPHCAQATELRMPPVPVRAPPVLPAGRQIPQPAVVGGETRFFDACGILVSNTRFVVGGQTYPMAGITAVMPRRREPNRQGPLLLIGFGVVLLFLAIFSREKLGLIISGLLVIGCGIPLFQQAKPTFFIEVVTASGHLTAIESHDGAMVENVLNALNQAIIARG